MRPVVQFLLVATALAAPARANMPAAREYPGTLSHAVITPAPSPLAVDDEALRIDCHDTPDGPRCALEATYLVSNPTDQAQGGFSALYGLRTTSVSVSVDGRRADVPLAPDLVASLDASLLRAEGAQSTYPSLDDPDLSRHGFRIDVAARGHARVVARGVLAPERNFVPSGYAYSAIQGRHPWLHAGDPAPRRYRFEYLLSPLRTWSGARRVHLVVTHPARWDVELGGADAEPRSADGRVERRATIDASRPDVFLLTLDVSLAGSAVEHGGPVVGLGGVTGNTDASGFRARLGYELAGPEWLVHAVTVDTNFAGRWLAALQSEATTPNLLFLPSLGFGLGVPVQLRPELHVGARAAATLALYPLGFTASFDWFPGVSARAGGTQLFLLGRFSF